MDLLGGNALTGMDITIGEKKVIRTWTLLVRGNESVILDLNLAYRVNSRLIIEHQTDHSSDVAYLSRSDSKDPMMIIITLFNYDKAGLSAWTSKPLTLFQFGVREEDRLNMNNIILDLVVNRLSGQQEPNGINWQYFITLYEAKVKNKEKKKNG